MQAAQVAKYSLLGLANRELTNYERGCNDTLDGYLGNEQYDFVPTNTANRKIFNGLKLAAILHLIKGFKEGKKEDILDKAQSKKISASVKALAIEQIVFRILNQYYPEDDFSIPRL